MKQLIYFSLCLVFVCSCTSNTIYNKPDNLIPEKEMVDLLVDMHIAVGAKAGKNYDEKFGIEYMPYVYEKYEIDSARFAQSIFYYETDIDNYTKILKKVKAKLEGKSAEIEAIIDEQDSIENIEKMKLKKRINVDSIPK